MRLRPFSFWISCLFTEMRLERVYRHDVSRRTEAADLAQCNRRDIGFVPKLLARVNIAQVNLDNRQFDRRYGVHQRDRCVGQRTSIQNDPAMRAFGGMDQIDQHTFVVGLFKGDVKALGRAVVAAHRFNI